MLNKILETLYVKVFINIIVNEPNSEVYVEVCSKTETLESHSATFKTTGINSEMYEYINEYVKLSPFFYISTIDKSQDQGALPTCEKNKMSEYIDTKLIKTICTSDNWVSYAYVDSLKEIRYEYKSVGLDFIFSPFKILANFFKDKINTNLAIFLLVQNRNISLSVFNKSSLLFADYLDIKQEKDSNNELLDSVLDDDYDEDDDSLEMDAVDLEDIEVELDEDDSLEDFSNIEGLDDFEEIEEFSEAKDIEEIVEHKEEEFDSEGLNDDYQRFSLIQESINSFYKDDRYDSEFIETIYIADSIGVSSDLKKYLEEEMFLSVVVRKMELPEALSSMAKMELA
jgi:hypothetical protein